MRTLNKKQEKFLLEWAKKHAEVMSGTWKPVDEMSYEDWKKLEQMNDHETLYQNSNRFLNDLNLQWHEDTHSFSIKEV